MICTVTWRGTADTGDVVVTNILDDCDAFRRGLRVDDEIVRFAGRSIRFVTLTKNPYSWLLSLYRRPYHAGEKAETFAEFLSLR